MSTAFGEPTESARRVPPIDPGLLTGPQSEARRQEQSEKATAIELEVTRVKEALGVARAEGRPTETFESQIAALTDRKRAIYRSPAWDPIEIAWPALRAKTAEIRQMVAEGKTLTVVEAQRLVDMLYVDIHPKLNTNLQIATLMHIKECCDKDVLSEDVRSLLRGGTLDYFNATRNQCDGNNHGAQCSPFSMFYLAQAIAGAANAGDAEAMEAFQYLKDAADTKCESLQWAREKGLIAGILSDLGEAMSLNDDDVHMVRKITEAELTEEEIGKLLRIYRKILKAPSRRVSRDVVVIIDLNLLLIADYELSRKNWALWGDDAIALGPQRASTGFRAFISQQPESKTKYKNDEIKRVKRLFERHTSEPKIGKVESAPLALKGVTHE